MIRNIITAASLVLATAATAHAGGGTEATNEVPEWMTRICHYEDSVNCQWNARTAGNGRGDSFYVRKFPGTDRICLIYIDRPRKDRCFRDR